MSSLRIPKAVHLAPNILYVAGGIYLVTFGLMNLATAENPPMVVEVLSYVNLAGLVLLIMAGYMHMFLRHRHCPWCQPGQDEAVEQAKAARMLIRDRPGSVYRYHRAMSGLRGLLWVVAMLALVGVAAFDLAGLGLYASIILGCAALAMGMIGHQHEEVKAGCELCSAQER